MLCLDVLQASLAYCTKLKKKDGGGELKLGYLIDLQKKASGGINSISNLSKAIRSGLLWDLVSHFNDVLEGEHRLIAHIIKFMCCTFPMSGSLSIPGGCF